MKTNIELCRDIELNGVKEIYFKAREEYEQALFRFITHNIFDVDSFELEWYAAIEDLTEDFYQRPFLGRVEIYNRMVQNAIEYGIESPPIQ